jgi:MFS family permease
MTATAPSVTKRAEGEYTVAPGRRRLIMLLVLLPVFVGSLDLTIISAILPEVLTKLNIPVDTNLGTAAWAVTGYLLAYTVSIIIMGRVSDLVGRRGAYLVCLAVFIVGSYWVGTAHEWPTALLNDFTRRVLGQRMDINQLTLLAVIIGRVIQALGAGALVPVSLALVADLYPPEERGAPVGIVGAADTLGWVLGHLYGGLMVNLFNNYGVAIREFLVSIGLNWPAPDWRTLFHLNVPLGLISFAAMFLVLRGVKHPVGRGRFDVIGAALISAAMVLLVVGLGGSSDVTGATSLSQMSSDTSSLPVNPALIGGGVAIFGVFLAFEWRQRYPLVELHLFRKRNISAATAANLFVGFCLMLGLVSVPLLVNLRAEDASAESIALAAERSGILLSALTIPMAMAAIPGAWLAGRVGYRNATLGGMAMAAVGFVIAAVTWNGTTSELVIALHMIIVGIGLGLTIAPIGTVVINEVDDSQRGVASALVLILRLVGMTLAISSMTTFALSRLNYLVEAARTTFAPGLTAEQIQTLSVQAYFNAGFQVISELLLVGAIVCGLGLIPVMFMRRTSVTPKEQGEAGAEPA